MRYGTYRGPKADFDRFLVRRFTPFFMGEPSIFFGGFGCGAHALSLLTGIPPSEFKDLNPHDHWSEDFMLRCLRKHKFKLLELTQACLTQQPYVQFPIDGRHVLLTSQFMMKNEGSWLLYHQGWCFHNFEVTPMDPFEFLNHPIQTAHLLQHNLWNPVKTLPHLSTLISRRVKSSSRRTS